MTRTPLTRPLRPGELCRACACGARGNIWTLPLSKVSLTTEPWELKAPFRITGYEFKAVKLLHASISEDGAAGHDVHQKKLS